MAAPTAPMPLANQIKQGTNITVTVVLRGMGAAPTFIDGGTTFNSGDPTATYTIAIGTNTSGAPGAVNTGPADEICDLLDRLQREGSAVVT